VSFTHNPVPEIRDARGIQSARRRIPKLVPLVFDFREFVVWYYTSPSRMPHISRIALAPLTSKQPEACPHCGSHVLTRRGTRKKKLEIVQLWRCASCKRVFTPGPAALRNKTYPPRMILAALTDYDTGYTLEEMAARLKKKTNRTVSPSTVAAWLQQYKRHCSYGRLRADGLARFPATQRTLHRLKGSKLANITMQDINQAIAGLKPTSRTQALGSLRAFFRWVHPAAAKLYRPLAARRDATQRPQEPQARTRRRRTQGGVAGRSIAGIPARHCRPIADAHGPAPWRDCELAPHERSCAFTARPPCVPETSRKNLH
jgi:transposase-like protein